MALDGCGEQLPGARRLAPLERGDSRLKKLFPFTLTLGDRASGAFDVGAGARMRAIEKQHPRPDTDCELMLSVEIMVEAGEEQFLDSR